MQERYGDAYALNRTERHNCTELWGIHDHIWDMLLSNPVDPWDSKITIKIDGPGQVQPMVALRTLQHVGDTYVQSWGGHVTVGPLVPVNDPPGVHLSGSPWPSPIP